MKTESGPAISFVKYIECISQRRAEPAASTTGPGRDEISEACQERAAGQGDYPREHNLPDSFPVGLTSDGPDAHEGSDTYMRGGDWQAVKAGTGDEDGGR